MEASEQANILPRSKYLRKQQRKEGIAIKCANKSVTNHAGKWQEYIKQVHKKQAAKSHHDIFVTVKS